MPLNVKLFRSATRGSNPILECDINIMEKSRGVRNLKYAFQLGFVGYNLIGFPCKNVEGRLLENRTN